MYSKDTIYPVEQRLFLVSFVSIDLVKFFIYFTPYIVIH